MAALVIASTKALQSKLASAPRAEDYLETRYPLQISEQAAWMAAMLIPAPQVLGGTGVEHPRNRSRVLPRH
jgi:hypothetical protein